MHATCCPDCLHCPASKKSSLPVISPQSCSPPLLPPDLIDVHTAFLEKHPLERGLDEAQRALATLTSLLAACPGDLQPMFQVCGVFGW